MTSATTGLTALGNADCDLSTQEASELGSDSYALFRTLCDRLATGLMLLPDKPEESVGATLRALWHMASGNRVSASAALCRRLARLDNSHIVTLHTLVDRRLAGEPLAHLTGRQQFLGLELLAGPMALIPRRETELLGNAAIRILDEIAAQVAHPCVVDVCTGCGNIALALASRHPSARIHAADLSADAVHLARRNADLLDLSGRIDFRVGDLLGPFESAEFLGQVDLLTCNPPYISTKRLESMPTEIADYEPALAFDGGPLGIRILQRIIQEAPRFLRPGGWLAFEVGLGQGPSVRKRLEGSGKFTNVEQLTDHNNDVRALIASV
jgi:release factor glutamine methyltransferase